LRKWYNNNTDARQVTPPRPPPFFHFCFASLQAEGGNSQKHTYDSYRMVMNIIESKKTEEGPAAERPGAWHLL